MIKAKYIDDYAHESYFAKRADENDKRRLAENISDFRRAFVLNYLALHASEASMDVDGGIRIEELLECAEATNRDLAEARRLTIAHFGGSIFEQGDITNGLEDEAGMGNHLADEMGALQRMINVEAFVGRTVEDCIHEIEAAIKNLVR